MDARKMTATKIQDTIIYLRCKQAEINYDLGQLTDVLEVKKHEPAINEVIDLGVELQAIDKRLAQLEAIYDRQ
jgi:hypothetical protein